MAARAFAWAGFIRRLLRQERVRECALRQERDGVGIRPHGWRARGQGRSWAVREIAVLSVRFGMDGGEEASKGLVEASRHRVAG